MKKLELIPVLKEGMELGIKNFVSLIVTTLLYLVTIWIPYLNIGTTIAMCAIPAELAKGNVINPTFIFESRFRRNMGEFFILLGLQSAAYGVGFFMGIIPAMVLSFAWMFAQMLFVDRNLNAMEALHTSNEMTYGHKKDMFLITLVFGAAVCIGALIVCVILGLISEFLAFFACLLIAVASIPMSLGLEAVMYRILSTPEEEKAE